MISRSARILPLAILLLVTAALSLAAAGDTTLPGDVRLAAWLQAHPIPLAEPLTSFTNDYMHGMPLFVAGTVLAAALLAARRTDAALLVALATTLRAANSLLKDLADSPRPTPNLVRVRELAEGLGFPSGHSMGSTLLLGALAYLLWPTDGRSDERRSAWTHNASRLVRRTGAIGCLGLILLTGYGRIHTGAHWSTDVLGGYLWGALLLLLVIWSTQAVLPRARSAVASLRRSTAWGRARPAEGGHPAALLRTSSGTPRRP